MFPKYRISRYKQKFHTVIAKGGPFQGQKLNIGFQGTESLQFGLRGHTGCYRWSSGYAGSTLYWVEAKV